MTTGYRAVPQAAGPIPESINRRGRTREIPNMGGEEEEGMAEVTWNLPFDRYQDGPATLFTGRSHRFHNFWDLCRHQDLCLLQEGSFRACRLTASIVLQQSRSGHGPLFFDV